MSLHYMDSAAVAKKLADAGASRDLADAIAQTTSEHIVMSYSGLATKADIEAALARVDAKIESAKFSVVAMFVATLIAVGGLYLNAIRQPQIAAVQVTQPLQK